MPRSFAPLSLALILAALSLPSGAMPLGVGPSLLQEGRRLAVVDGVVEDQAYSDEQLPDVVLDEQVAEHLLASERRARDRRRALLDQIERSRVLRGEQSVRPSSAGEAFPDPLAQALRRFVTTDHLAGGPAGGAPAAKGRNPADFAAREFEDGGDAALAVQDADEKSDVELRARMLVLKERAANAIDRVLSPELGADGKAGFSVLGVGGFRVDTADGQTNVAFRDVSFSSMNAVAGGPLPGPQAGFARAGARAGDDEGERRAALRLVFLMWDVATHPVTLGLLLVVVFFRFVAALAGRGRAY